MNVVEPILFQAKYQPETPALCAPGIDIVSYARLTAQMNNIARRAMSLGLKRGDVVVLSIDQSILHATVILGLAQVGIVSVSVGTQKLPPGLKVDAVVSNVKYPHAADVRHLPLDFSWIMGDGKPPEAPLAGSTAQDEIWRICLTSGTTGKPKAVPLTHRISMDRIAQYSCIFGANFACLSRAFLHMSIATASASHFLIHFLGRGGTVYFDGDTAERTLRAFGLFEIQTLLAIPTNLAGLVASCDRHPTIEINLDTIISTGSSLHRALLERVRPRLCRHLFVVYGAAETGYNISGPADRFAHIPGAVGYAHPGSLVEIVDDADRPVPPGVEGNIRLAAELAVERYADDPIGSRQVLRNGRFYTGDLGSVSRDNLVIVSGRRDHVLNVGGGKAPTETVEAALASFESASEVAVFVAPNALGIDELWAAVVWREGADAENLREYCSGRMPVHFVPAHIVTLDALPVTANGKVDRPRLKQMLLNAARS